jgi:hypothetical protein
LFLGPNVRMERINLWSPDVSDTGVQVDKQRRCKISTSVISDRLALDRRQRTRKKKLRVKRSTRAAVA